MEDMAVMGAIHRVALETVAMVEIASLAMVVMEEMADEHFCFTFFNFLNFSYQCTNVHIR